MIQALLDVMLGEWGESGTGFLFHESNHLQYYLLDLGRHYHVFLLPVEQYPQKDCAPGCEFIRREATPFGRRSMGGISPQVARRN